MIFGCYNMDPSGDGLWTHSAVSAYGAVGALSLIGMEWNQYVVCYSLDIFT